MKTIAEIDPLTAVPIVEFLKTAGIPCDMLSKTDENGLDVTELVVGDDHFEKACEVIEQWDAQRMAEVERLAQRRCPFCNSARVKFVDDLDYKKSITKISAVYRCDECGRITVPRG